MCLLVVFFVSWKFPFQLCHLWLTLLSTFFDTWSSSVVDATETFEWMEIRIAKSWEDWPFVSAFSLLAINTRKKLYYTSKSAKIRCFLRFLLARIWTQKKRKIIRFLHMIQVCSQKYKTIFFFKNVFLFVL